MEIKATDTFFKSLKITIASISKWWTFWYWKHRWYMFKRAIKSLWVYFPIVCKMVPWDYSSVLQMMQFQIKNLADYIEKYGIEVDDQRLIKVQRMRRFIELAQNHLDDNYSERCGYKYIGFDFVKSEEHPECYEMVELGTEEEQKNNVKAIKEGHKLEEKEWKEMVNILKDMRGWWD